LTLFEYIMVMVSVILALALAQLLRALTEIATSPKRYWVHTLWVGLLAFIGVQTWWGFWDLNAFERWTTLTYLYVLAIPTLIFMSAHLLVPATRLHDFDWHAHFYEIRRWFFSVLSGLIVFATLATWIFLDAPLLHPYRAFQLALLAGAVSGALIASARWHTVLAVAFLLVFTLSQVVIRINPGALAQG
jgi:hypothetical protein